MRVGTFINRATAAELHMPCLNSINGTKWQIMQYANGACHSSACYSYISTSSSGTGNLRKQGVVMQSGFILLRTGSNGWLLWLWWGIQIPWKVRNFLTSWVMISFSIGTSSLSQILSVYLSNSHNKKQCFHRKQMHLFKPSHFNVTWINILCDSVRSITKNDCLNKEYFCMSVKVFWIYVHKFLSHLGSLI